MGAWVGVTTADLAVTLGGDRLSRTTAPQADVSPTKLGANKPTVPDHEGGSALGHEAVSPKQKSCCWPAHESGRQSDTHHPPGTSMLKMLQKCAERLSDIDVRRPFKNDLDRYSALWLESARSRRPRTVVSRMIR